jgi:hypothetical protein
LSVTKFRPGLQTMTRAAVIFMAAGRKLVKWSGQFWRAMPDWALAQTLIAYRARAQRSGRAELGQSAGVGAGRRRQTSVCASAISPMASTMPTASTQFGR